MEPTQEKQALSSNGVSANGVSACLVDVTFRRAFIDKVAWVHYLIMAPAGFSFLGLSLD